MGLLLFLGNSGLSQLTITPSGFAKIIDCGKADTIVVKIRNTSGSSVTVSNISLSFQSNMQFVSGALNCTQSGGTLSNPILSFTPATIASGATDSIKFTARALCGYTAGVTTPSVGITVNTTSPVATYNANFQGYSAVQPNITFTEFPNSFSVKPRIDIIQRDWTIQQTQPNASVSMLHVFNQFTDLELVDLTIGGSPINPSYYTLTASTLMISLPSSTFLTVGDNDTLFESGESLVIRARFKSIGCNMSSQMRAGFSCVNNPVTDADFCLVGASNRVSPSFNYTARQVSSKIYQVDAPLELSCPGSFDTITFAITNSSNTTDSGATMFDVFPFGGYAIRPEAKDSAINGVTLHKFIFDNGATILIEGGVSVVQALENYPFATADFDGTGGFSDVDSDGIYDDILPGDTVYFHLVVYKRVECQSESVLLRYNNGICDYSYRTQCNNLITRSHAYNSYQTTNVTGGVDTSTLNNGFGEYRSYASYDPFGSSFPQNVYLNDTNYFYARYGNYYALQGCDTVISRFIVKGRPGIEYPQVPGHAYYGGNSNPTSAYGTVLSHNDLGNGDLELIVKHGVNYYLGFLKIPFKVNCTYFASNPYCEIADSLKFSLINTRKCSSCTSTCYDTVNIGEQPFYTNVLNPPSNPCAIAYSDVLIDSLNIYRTTYGWTDSSKSTKVDSSTGAYNKAMVGDSVQFYAHANVYSGTHDSIIFQFKVYDINRQYAFLDSSLIVYDASLASIDTIKASRIEYNTSNFTVRVVFAFTTTPIEAGDSLVFNNPAFVTRGHYNMTLPTSDLSNDVYADLYYNNSTPTFEKCISKSQKFQFYSNVLGKTVFITTQNMCDDIYALYTIGYFTTYGQERFPNEYREVISFDTLRITLEDHFDFDTTRPLGYFNKMSERYVSDTVLGSDFSYDPVTNTLTIVNDSNRYKASDIDTGAYFKGQTIGQIGVRVPISVNCMYIPTASSINPARIEFYGDIDKHSDSLSRKIRIPRDSAIWGYNPSHYPIDIGYRPNLVNYTLNSFVKNQYSSNYGATLQLDVTNSSQDINGNPTVGSQYFYITILDTNEMLEITGVSDNLSNTYSNYYRLNDSAWIIEIDSMQMSQNLTFSIDVNYKICSNEVIEVALGWQCDSYPTEVVDVCRNTPSATFLANPGLAGIATTVVSQPVGPQNLCDTLTYQIELTNTNVGAADSLNFKYFLPSSGAITVHSIVATIDSVSNNLTGVNGTNHIAYDLKNHLLDSTVNGIFENNDTILITLKLLTVCGAVSEETHAFSTDGRQVCGDYISVSNIETSTPVAFAGVVKTYDATLSGELVNQCLLQNYKISLLNIGGAASNDTTRLQDTIFVQLPNGTVFNNNSYLSVHNPLPNGTPNIVGSTLKFGLPSGVGDGDSVIFYIGLSMLNDTCNATDSIALTSYQFYNLTCGAVICPTGIVNGQDIHPITKTQADLTVQISNSTLNLCSDSIQTQITIINNSVKIDSSVNTVIYFAVDSNNNGVYDSTDVIITGSQLTYTDSIGANDTIYLTHQFLASTYPGDFCELIALIDTTSCVCNTSFDVDTIELIYIGIDTLTTCENDSLQLNICGGASSYPSRTYLWKALTPGTISYLSDTTVLSPTFYPPNSNQDTIFAYVIQVDRGGCVNTDTIWIEVLSAPNTFTISDTMLCPGDVLALQVNSPQMGVYYTAWDAMTGGTLIDTLPFNLSINRDSILYIEAVDSFSTCNSNSRVAVTLFLDSIAPTVVCQDTVVYLDASGNVTIDSSFVNNGSTDNCNLVSLWLSRTTFNCSDIGVQQVTLYGIDNSGNLDSCSANVTVNDSVKPVLNCLNGSAYLDNTGSVTIDTTGIVGSFNDNCGVASIYISSASNTTFDCSHIGIAQSVTIIIEDNSGNIDSCSSLIDIYDTVKPVVVCQNFDVYLDTTSQSIITANDIDGGTSDNCVSFTISIVDSLFDCSRLGMNAVWLYAIDGNGNIDSCQATVTVHDTTSPSLICINDQYDTIFDNTCEFIIPDYTSQLTIVDDCLDTNNIVYSQIPLPGTVISVTDSQVINIQLIVMDSVGGNQNICYSNLFLRCIKRLIVPQFISPNGDGLNDVLFIEFIEEYPENTLQIFNRWGDLVYVKEQYDNSWGGDLGVSGGFIGTDNKLPSGTYFYILDLGIEGGEGQTGFIQIRK